MGESSQGTRANKTAVEKVMESSKLKAHSQIPANNLGCCRFNSPLLPPQRLLAPGAAHGGRGMQPCAVRSCRSTSSSAALAWESSTSSGEATPPRDAPSHANRACKVRSWQEFTCYRER